MKVMTGPANPRRQKIIIAGKIPECKVKKFQKIQNFSERVSNHSLAGFLDKSQTSTELFFL